VTPRIATRNLATANRVIAQKTRILNNALAFTAVGTFAISYALVTDKVSALETTDCKFTKQVIKKQD
jgi:hypothetical protein